jgi:hypothetical protein
MARVPDPFKPPSGAAFSNGQVNRAGQLLRRWYLRPEDQTPEDFGTTFDELVDAMIAVTWWRGLHAKPLSRVAANLRYHVAAEGAEVDGPSRRHPASQAPADHLQQARARAYDAANPDVGHRRRSRPLTFAPPSPSGQPSSQKDLDDRADQGLHRGPPQLGVPRHASHRARNGRLIEVQLRTVRQDAWANQVEDDSRRQSIGYKFGHGEEDIHDYYRVVSEAFAALDRGEELSTQLVAAINEIYERVAGKLQRQQVRGGD